jgi:hypothetical protein
MLLQAAVHQLLLRTRPYVRGRCVLVVARPRKQQGSSVISRTNDLLHTPPSHIFVLYT